MQVSTRASPSGSSVGSLKRSLGREARLEEGPDSIWQEGALLQDRLMLIEEKDEMNKVR